MGIVAAAITELTGGCISNWRVRLDYVEIVSDRVDGHVKYVGEMEGEAMGEI